MRLVLRIAGTWLIGLALVLLVVDGTKSLGANHIVFTSLSQIWTQIHAASLDSIWHFFDSRMFAEILSGGLNALLAYPAFAVLGVPGIVLALMGRRPRGDRFLRQEQI